ncbi:MAG: glycosyltransferase family 4 protein [Desulfobacterales bacterium]|nr:glycosyltransferase family 4 protein [Desulfobacterales bacterium]
MKFCLINRYFWPDESATSLLLTDFAEDLAEKGHEVHVLASRQLYNHPKANLDRFQNWQGIKIHRVFSTSFGRSTFLGRLLDITTYRWALSLQKQSPDAWFVMTDPPLILEQVVKMKNRSGGKIIHHVDDVYPELAVALGAIPGTGLFGNWINRRSRKALGECDKVLALGECMADVLKKKDVPENRIQITPPWADGKRLDPLPHKENAFRRELGFSDQDFVVMYSGNMGKGHRFETILDAAGSLVHEKKIHFVFIGGGAKKKEIEKFCKKHRLENCRIVPYQPREKLKLSLSAGDIHLISLDSRVQGLIVPSKLAGILAVGRPVIFVGDSHNSVARAVLRGECGFVIPGKTNFSTPARQLQDAVSELYQNSDLRKMFEKNARHLFEEEYSREVVVPRIISCLEN